jgi:hypothetical protein
MAALAYELAASRVYNDSETQFGVESSWQVVGATSYADAATALAALLPATQAMPGGRTAYLSSVAARELRDNEYFTFDVSYASQPPSAANETEYEFDVSARTERTFQSLATTAYNPAGKTTPNFGSAMGVASGFPQGVEPLNSFSTFAITKHWPLASVTEAYQVTMEGLVGSVNNSTFASRAAGTVRFLGARGRRQGDKFPIQYSFGFRPNVSAFVVDAITVTSANGWDIIDPFYEWFEDTSAKKPTSRARCVYVHQIHPLVSFAGLGL